MSPEELKRTIDFIIESQARLAIAQEMDRERRIELQTLTVQVVKLIDYQSERIDWNEKEQQKARKRHEGLRAVLNRILDKLTDKPS